MSVGKWGEINVEQKKRVESINWSESTGKGNLSVDQPQCFSTTRDHYWSSLVPSYRTKELPANRIKCNLLGKVSCPGICTSEEIDRTNILEDGPQTTSGNAEEWSRLWRVNFVMRTIVRTGSSSRTFLWEGTCKMNQYTPIDSEKKILIKRCRLSYSIWRNLRISWHIPLLCNYERLCHYNIQCDLCRSVIPTALLDSCDRTKTPVNTFFRRIFCNNSVTVIDERKKQIRSKNNTKYTTSL